MSKYSRRNSVKRKSLKRNSLKRNSLKRNSLKRNSNKNNFDKYIGKVAQLKLPKNSRISWFWIVRKKENGKYIIRSPKIGVLIKDLDKLRDKDYGPEKLMPNGTKLF